MNISLDDDKTFFGHCGDLAYELNGAQKLLQIERDLGIRGILEHLKQAGWEAYQWRNSREGRTSFLELSGLAYSDFRRTESKTGIKHAAEAMLNRVQAIVRCEKTVGHDFTSRKGYDNGVLACHHCGFGGYSSNYLQQARDARNWQERAESAHSRLALIALRTGVRFNAVDQVLLPNASLLDSGVEDGYTVVGDTDKVSFVLKRETEGGSE